LPLSLYISVECEPLAKRVVRYSWPDAIELDRVQDIDAVWIRSIQARCAGAKFVLVCAGWPCQDLSSLNAAGEGLTGSKSSLFWEIIRVRSLLLELWPEVGIVLMLENVASMSRSDRLMVSKALDCQPVAVDASDVTACARPRLYWLSAARMVPWTGLLTTSGGLQHLRIPGDPGVCSRWLTPGCSFQGLVDDIPEIHQRLPTFVRCLPSWKPPWKPRGLERCAPHEVARWKSFRFCYAPYQFKDKNCIQEPSGFLRPPTALEREVLLDFEPRHTMTCLPTSARKQKALLLEDSRCSLLGNSFSCAVVAWLIAHWAVAEDLLPFVPTVADMRRQFATGLWEDSVVGAPIVRSNLSSPRGHSSPSVQLVHQLMRSTDSRGSDIRVDTQQMIRPNAWPRRPLDVNRWFWKTIIRCKWKRQAHITELECRAILLALRWRFRSCANLRTRFLHLSDSQAGIGVFTKGRSSSLRLNAVIRRADAYMIASLCRAAYGYTETDRNPADFDSRL